MMIIVPSRFGVRVIHAGSLDNVRRDAQTLFCNCFPEFCQSSPAESDPDFQPPESSNTFCD
jgi:hypothetical protein